MFCLHCMTIITVLSLTSAFLSFFWHALFTIKAIGKLSALLNGLLLIEASCGGQIDMAAKRIAVGFGAHMEWALSGVDFMNYTDFLNESLQLPREIYNKQQLYTAFGYYMRTGKTVEHIVINENFFNELIQDAKLKHAKNLTTQMGGNALVMALRFYTDGAHVLLAADMTKKMRAKVSRHLTVLGKWLDKDDLHLVLQYNHKDRFGRLKAWRDNNLILQHDKHSMDTKMVVAFDAAVKQFLPHLVVLSGLQFMNNELYTLALRKERLVYLEMLLQNLPLQTLTHFEIFQFVDLQIFELIRKLIIPYMNSLSMNEHQLFHLRFCLQYERLPDAEYWEASVTWTLDQMRFVLQMLYVAYDQNESKSRVLNKRRISRLHVHTQSYQVVLTVLGSQWKQSKLAVAKASLAANRFACQKEQVQAKIGSFMFNEYFLNTHVTLGRGAKRLKLDLTEGVLCWRETIQLYYPLDMTANGTRFKNRLDLEFCLAPVLICREPKRTAGLAEHVSAAALAVQI